MLTLSFSLLALGWAALLSADILKYHLPFYALCASVLSIGFFVGSLTGFIISFLEGSI